MTLGAFRGHFEVTLGISTSNFMCDACVMHTCTGLVGPKSGNVEKPLVFVCFFEVSIGLETANRTNDGAIRSTLGSLWSHSGVTLGIFG